jgi:hypothetical protein
MMDRFCQTALEHLSLQPSLQKILNLQCQHVIEPHTGFVQHSNSNETTNKRITLEQSFRVFGIELQELTSGTTDFRKDQGDTPDFSLVAETIFAGKLFVSTVSTLSIQMKSNGTPSARHRGELIRKVDEGPCNCKVIK